MRLMADEMFQLTFQIENLDQILENPRVYNSSPDKILIWMKKNSLKWSESNDCDEMKFDSFQNIDGFHTNTQSNDA